MILSDADYEEAMRALDEEEKRLSEEETGYGI